mmetsp:Transcript_56358/g.142541  ORF Transcript_56358/g.142541 Transcript_56358/m.142541 type:complete len:330 (+) Transcript_56358:2061-3050(+)
MRMMLPSFFISWMMFLRRSSNSPRYLVPDSSIPRSNSMIRLSINISGTSPSTMRLANPSAMAVLPTPGSPMSTGLFFCRRARIWMARSISSSLPTNGSISPSAAFCVRSVPNSSNAEPLDEGSPLRLDTPPASSFPSPVSATSDNAWSSFAISSGSAAASTFNVSSILATFPSLSFTMVSKICAGSTTSEPNCLASCTLDARSRLAAGVNGISVGTTPLPFPNTFSRAFLASLTLTPSFFNTLPEVPTLSATTPTRIISVLTKFCPKSRASSCAFQITLSARSLKRSNIMDMDEAADVFGAVPGADVTEPANEEPRKDEPLDDTPAAEA